MHDTEQKPSNSEAALAYVKEWSDRLHGLLSDPHPGLIAWGVAFGTAMTNLSNYWAKGYPQCLGTDEVVK